MSKGLFYQAMCYYDRIWRKLHKVKYINELVSLSLVPWKGERKAMNDGSWVEPGDCLAILHFNRECMINPGTSPKDYARAALHFRKLILASFGELTELFRSKEEFGQVKALYGVSWLPPHGEKVGFMIEKVPDSWGNRLRNFYFKILLKTFFPVLAARQREIQSYAYWLTRQQLFRYFSPKGLTNDTETVFETYHGKERICHSSHSAIIIKSLTDMNKNIRQRSVCLTFDDGPDPVFTPGILDILAEHKVCANFFVVGEFAEQYPQLVIRMLEDGHTVGNHTFHHYHPWTLLPCTARDEVTQTSQRLQQITGMAPRWFRPPHGRLRCAMLEQAKAEGMKTVLWTRSMIDWGALGTDKVGGRSADLGRQGDPRG